MNWSLPRAKCERPRGSDDWIPQTLLQYTNSATRPTIHGMRSRAHSRLCNFFPSSGVARGGPRGPCPPQTVGKCFFSPINLRCYVLLVCKWSLTRWRYFLSSVMITRRRYCLSAAMITRWHYYIDAVMITRWHYFLNAVMITRWQYCPSATIVTRWHYCTRVEMVTGWVHWIVNVSNCKELCIARRKHRRFQTVRKYH